MDVGANDVRPIFCKNLLRQTHAFIEIFHKKFPIFSFMDKPSEKSRIFSNFIETTHDKIYLIFGCKKMINQIMIIVATIIIIAMFNWLNELLKIIFKNVNEESLNA